MRSPRGARPRRRVRLVSAPDSSRKISLAGSKPGRRRRHARRARAMSGRSCSLARSVFSYMSAPTSPAHSASIPAARPRAVPSRSGHASCPAGLASDADEPPESSACAPSDGCAHRSRRCVGAAARVSSPCPATRGNDWQSLRECPPFCRRKIRFVRAVRITALCQQYLQFCLNRQQSLVRESTRRRRNGIVIRAITLSDTDKPRRSETVTAEPNSTAPDLDSTRYPVKSYEARLFSFACARIEGRRRRYRHTNGCLPPSGGHNCF
jgi:hypothetical protein